MIPRDPNGEGVGVYAVFIKEALSAAEASFAKGATRGDVCVGKDGTCVQSLLPLHGARLPDDLFTQLARAEAKLGRGPRKRRREADVLRDEALKAGAYELPPPVAAPRARTSQPPGQAAVDPAGGEEEEVVELVSHTVASPAATSLLVRPRGGAGQMRLSLGSSSGGGLGSPPSHVLTRLKTALPEFTPDPAIVAAKQAKKEAAEAAAAREAAEAAAVRALREAETDAVMRAAIGRSVPAPSPVVQADAAVFAAFIAACPALRNRCARLHVVAPPARATGAFVLLLLPDDGASGEGGEGEGPPADPSSHAPLAVALWLARHSRVPLLAVRLGGDGSAGGAGNAGVDAVVRARGGTVACIGAGSAAEVVEGLAPLLPLPPSPPSQAAHYVILQERASAAESALIARLKGSGLACPLWAVAHPRLIAPHRAVLTAMAGGGGAPLPFAPPVDEPPPGLFAPFAAVASAALACVAHADAVAGEVGAEVRRVEAGVAGGWLAATLTACPALLVLEGGVGVPPAPPSPSSLTLAATLLAAAPPCPPALPALLVSEWVRHTLWKAGEAHTKGGTEEEFDIVAAAAWEVVRVVGGGGGGGTAGPPAPSASALLASSTGTPAWDGPAAWLKGEVGGTWPGGGLAALLSLGRELGRWVAVAGVEGGPAGVVTSALTSALTALCPPVEGGEGGPDIAWLGARVGAPLPEAVWALAVGVACGVVSVPP